jgi:hypothetical protein
MSASVCGNMSRVEHRKGGVSFLSCCGVQMADGFVLPVMPTAYSSAQPRPKNMSISPLNQLRT